MLLGLKPRAELGDQLRGCFGGQQTRLLVTVAMGEAIQESTGKHVAGAVGVHCLHRGGGNLNGGAAIKQQGAVFAQGDGVAFGDAFEGFRRRFNVVGFCPCLLYTSPSPRDA